MPESSSRSRPGVTQDHIDMIAFVAKVSACIPPGTMPRLDALDVLRDSYGVAQVIPYDEPDIWNAERLLKDPEQYVLAELWNRGYRPALQRPPGDPGADATLARITERMLDERFTVSERKFISPDDDLRVLAAHDFLRVIYSRPLTETSHRVLKEVRGEAYRTKKSLLPSADNPEVTLPGRPDRITDNAYEAMRLVVWVHKVLRDDRETWGPNPNAEV